MSWRMRAALCWFPITAALHHGIIHRPTCILEGRGDDYSVAVVLGWLASDTSPTLAAALTVLLYAAGNRLSWLQPTAWAAFWAFLPLTLWVFDIPGTGRIICDLAHDMRVGIRGRYLYLFGVAFMVGWWLRTGRRTHA